MRLRKPIVCGGCGKDNWCMVNELGTEFLCMRVQSPKSISMSDGSVGYIHKASGTPVEYKPEPRREKPMMDMDAVWRHMMGSTKDEWRRKLADSLGVSFESVMALGASWYPRKQVWAFPMRNGAGKIVGIRLRSDLGKKWALTGSSNGLFIPADDYTTETVYAAEGPTDCMAGYTMGLKIIGRFNNSGGLPDMLDFIKANKVRRMVLIADNDEVKIDKKTGARRYPGTEGAEAMAANLPIQSLVLTLPVKDLRAFLQHGGTKQMLQSLEKSMTWRLPTSRG